MSVKQKAVDLLTSLNWKAFGYKKNYIEINKKGRVVKQTGDMQQIVSELDEQIKILHN